MFGGLLESRSAVREIEAWKEVKGLHCRLGAPAHPYDISALPRSARRTMSPMSEMGSLAAIQAVEHAGLNLKEMDFSRTLLSMGSTTGSPKVMEEYFKGIHNNLF